MYNIFHCEFCGEDYAINNEDYNSIRYYSDTRGSNWQPHSCEKSKDQNRIEKIKLLNKLKGGVIC